MSEEAEQGFYHSISTELKNCFGGKIVKLALDGGFTCPNRDGTVGIGGCSFCSSKGSGEIASDIPSQIELLSAKWPTATGYIAYFQSHTNTYASVERLEALYREALSHPNVMGLAIATRPDCLPPGVLDLLEKLNSETYLWVELGLQTIHDHTAKNMNRGYDLTIYDHAIENLTKRNIRVVTHLILGLPGETKKDMFQSVQYVTAIQHNAHPIFGLKLHLLNVVKGSLLERHIPGYTSFDTLESYVHLVCDLLPLVPWEVTIHRLTGDVPRSLLISPPWSYKKRTILNTIQHEMVRRGKKQGCDATPQPPRYFFESKSGPNLPSL